MYYEYFRERAAACRRSADGANMWLTNVSIELADMFDEMADDALRRELSRRDGKADAPVARSRSLRERFADGPF